MHLLAALVLLASADVPAEVPWERVSASESVTIYRRPSGPSGLTETMAVGVVAAPPWVVKNALDDYAPKVGQMPYLKEAKVLKRDARGAIIYNRASPPLVDDRDYTILMFDASFLRKDPDGKETAVYVARWRTANDEGPAPRDGVVRIERCDGYWQLEPVDGGKKTRATYVLVASPGGNLPQSIADWGTTTGMEGVFEALRKRVTVKAYAVTPPPMPKAQ